MIIRIVKMTFHPDKVKDFMGVFNTSCEKIRSFDGCTHLELLRDQHHPNIFFTFSKWKSVQHLENYRQSEFFAATWTKTKKLFSDKPEAWTTETV